MTSPRKRVNDNDEEDDYRKHRNTHIADAQFARYSKPGIPMVVNIKNHRTLNGLYWEYHMNHGQIEYTYDGEPTWLIARRHGNVIVFVLDLLRRCLVEFEDYPDKPKELQRMARAIQIGYGEPLTDTGIHIAECIIPEGDTTIPYRRAVTEFTVPALSRRRLLE